MKKRHLSMLLAGFLFVGFASCSKSDDTPDEPPVDPGKIVIDGSKAEALEGTSYHIVALDDESRQKIQSQIVQDFAPDESKYVLNTWSGTLVANERSGPNSFDKLDDWTALKTSGAQAWAGCGFCRKEGGGASADLTKVTGEYTLHFAMKSRSTNTFNILLADDSGTGTHGPDGKKEDYRIGIGQKGKEYEDVEILTDFPRDGDWHHIEIPMQTFVNKGLKYANPSTNNIFAVVLAGTPVNITLDIDAIFFYKKKAK